MSARSPVSSLGEMPLRRVMPNAATLACRSLRSRALEILEVLRVGKRVAALDVVDAEVIEPLRDAELILKRKVDALALTAVAECRVVDVNACHEAAAPARCLSSLVYPSTLFAC